MSRSCHSATFSRPAWRVAAQHPREAGDALGGDRVALVGHRARALLARPERLLDLAHLGALEVADLGGEALEPGAGERDRARAARRGGRAARPGWRRARRSSPRRSSTRASKSGPVRGVGADRARDRADRGLRRTPAPGARRCGAASKAKPASLSPNVVGSAWTPWVRPTQSVSRCSRARSASAVDELARAGERRSRPAAASWSASAVSSTSEEVRPKWIQRPAAPADSREHVDERGDVVVGDLLALLDGLDRERRGADRVELLRRSAPVERLGRGDLDLAPGLHAGLRRSTARPARGGCSGRSRPAIGSRIRAASTAALRALSTPTQATGTPGGICAIDSSASRPPAADVARSAGTPITGRSVCAATTPGSAAERPGAGDDHLQPAHLRVARVVGDHVGVAVGGHHADLVRMPRSSSSLAAFSIAGMSLLEPMTIPTRGASTSRPSNSSSTSARVSGAPAGCSHHARAPRSSAMSWRICLPSKSITGRSIRGLAGVGRAGAQRRSRSARARRR